ncbi:unnamed protein product, partial [Mesorhabditis spiculigera]
MPPTLDLTREHVPKKDKDRQAVKKQGKEKEQLKEKQRKKDEDKEKDKEKEKDKKKKTVPVERDEEVGEEALAKVEMVSLETWLERKAAGLLAKKDCKACPKTEHEQRHKKGLCSGCYQRSGRGNDATHNARCVIYPELKELKGVSAIMLHFAADAACTLCWRHHHLLPTD